MLSKMKNYFGRGRKIKELTEQVVLQTVLQSIKKGINCSLGNAFPLLKVHEMEPSCVDDCDSGNLWVMAHQIVEWCIDQNGDVDKTPSWYKLKKKEPCCCEQK